MSTETIDGLYALAIVLGGAVVSISAGLVVAHLLFDEWGRLRRWRR